MAFFWVNLGNTFKEVAEHKFLWAPEYKINSNGKTIFNVGWKHVSEVLKGDVIFCHARGPCN